MNYYKVSNIYVSNPDLVGTGNGEDADSKDVVCIGLEGKIINAVSLEAANSTGNWISLTPECAKKLLELLQMHLTPKLLRTKIKPLWSCSHYDGPMAGVGQLENGEYCWFHCDDLNHYPRQYQIYPLTLAEFTKENKRQQLFRDNVGHHCEYDENKKRKSGPYHNPDQSKISETYKAMDAIRNWKQTCDYESRNPLGYCEASTFD